MPKHLEKYRTGRRTVNKETLAGRMSYKTPSQILQIIQRDQWPYKTKKEFYKIRDLALGSLLFLSSGRINEILRLRVEQIKPDPEDQDFMFIQAFYVSKRKEGKQHPTPDIPLPLIGSLSPFTHFVMDYLHLLEPDDKLFKFGRARAWTIIRHITKKPGSSEPGYWNHWFRAQSLSYQVSIIRSTVAVSKQRGVENPQTLAHYDRGEWKTYKEDLKR